MAGVCLLAHVLAKQEVQQDILGLNVWIIRLRVRKLPFGTHFHSVIIGSLSTEVDTSL